MPLVQTRGAASAQGFGEFAQVTAANYIEDVFSTYLYTGNGTTQTITNGIDLATKGGLVWQKDRTTAATDNVLCDTAQGVNYFLRSNLTNLAVTNGGTDAVYAFNSNGFSTGTTNGFNINLSGDATVAWTFAKQPKFFDIQTWTGTGSNTTIAHNLGSVPGSIFVKRRDTSGDWQVYHRSLANTQYMVLNSTAAAATGATRWNSTTATSAVFSLGTDATVNASGGTYVAYIFAHDAGGFGLTGTDSVISCGSFTTNASGEPTGNVGTAFFDSQWVMIKRTDNVSNWMIVDDMRGFTATSSGGGNELKANTSAAEAVENLVKAQGNSTSSTIITPFGSSYANATYIYIAIRRGPMKVPTLGTSVFSPVTYTGDDSNTNRVITTGFPVDSAFFLRRESDNRPVYDRLRGQGARVDTNYANAESEAGSTKAVFSSNTGMLINFDSSSNTNQLSATYVLEAFRRAPGFFDEVCYTGTGADLTLSHNLTVAPQLMIVKRRSNSQAWAVGLPTGSLYLVLNQTTQGYPYFADYFVSAPTASVFYINDDNGLSVVSNTYVAYLFATCAGVSKVGSYTGNGSTQTIDCGFTGGARFVLIKRTDAAGDWYVYDTARGMTVLTDPYIRLNASGEFATLGSVTTVSTGFALNSAILADINVSAGTYIFLAIA